MPVENNLPIRIGLRQSLVIDNKPGKKSMNKKKYVEQLNELRWEEFELSLCPFEAFKYVLLLTNTVGIFNLSKASLKG